mmetsp:Transcript_28446/g.71278  ORF Transcript_28446/g.71278 Transcript_28446/m.71278 type:complete len:218 (-) Transcript_28446:1182-1835(-)
MILHPLDFLRFPLHYVLSIVQVLPSCTLFHHHCILFVLQLHLDLWKLPPPPLLRRSRAGGSGRLGLNVRRSRDASERRRERLRKFSLPKPLEAHHVCKGCILSLQRVKDPKIKLRLPRCGSRASATPSRRDTGVGAGSPRDVQPLARERPKLAEDVAIVVLQVRLCGGALHEQRRRRLIESPYIPAAPACASVYGTGAISLVFISALVFAVVPLRRL